MSMRGWLIGGSIAALVVGVVAYAASPYLAASSLAEALRTADRDKLAQIIDFPRVRDKLKAQMVAQAAEQQKGDTSGFGVLGAALATSMIDNLVTPDMLAVGLKKGSNPLELKVGQATRFSGNYSGLNHFVISTGEKDGAQLELARVDPFTWKVVGFDLAGNKPLSVSSLKGPAESAKSPASGAPTLATASMIEGTVPATEPDEAPAVPAGAAASFGRSEQPVKGDDVPHSAQFVACKDAASNTNATLDCLKTEESGLDNQLGVAYKLIMDNASPGGKLTLRTSERAWLKDIASKCRPDPQGGTYAPVKAGFCVVDSKAKRLDYLKELQGGSDNF